MDQSQNFVNSVNSGNKYMTEDARQNRNMENSRSRGRRSARDGAQRGFRVGRRHNTFLEDSNAQNQN